MRKGEGRESGEVGHANLRPAHPLSPPWERAGERGKKKANVPPSCRRSRLSPNAGEDENGFQIATRPETKPRPAQNRNHSAAAWTTW